MLPCDHNLIEEGSMKREEKGHVPPRPTPPPKPK
nr:MAG TPA: hypothetical protein [Caudoviricetes sp.]